VTQCQLTAISETKRTNSSVGWYLSSSTCIPNMSSPAVHAFELGIQLTHRESQSRQWPTQIVTHDQPCMTHHPCLTGNNNTQVAPPQSAYERTDALGRPSYMAKPWGHNDSVVHVKPVNVNCSTCCRLPMMLTDTSLLYATWPIRPSRPTDPSTHCLLCCAAALCIAVIDHTT